MNEKVNILKENECETYCSKLLKISQITDFLYSIQMPVNRISQSGKRMEMSS